MSASAVRSCPSCKGSGVKSTHTAWEVTVCRDCGGEGFVSNNGTPFVPKPKEGLRGRQRSPSRCLICGVALGFDPDADPTDAEIAARLDGRKKVGRPASACSEAHKKQIQRRRRKLLPLLRVIAHVMEGEPEPAELPDNYLLILFMLRSERARVRAMKRARKLPGIAQRNTTKNLVNREIP